MPSGVFGAGVNWAIRNQASLCWNVTISEIPLSKKTISQTLIEHCRNVEAGLLVMGAYEHSPLREGLFGGVTQDISLGSEIPVLMSH
jgi:nucleotide-binding universal stress UspA family protein